MSKINRVMGIDPSTKTGIVVLSDKNGQLHCDHSEMITFPKLRGMKRVVAFGDQIKECLAMWQPDVVVIEGYAYGNVHTLVTLVEIGTSIRLAVGAWPPLIVVQPSKLKRFVSGKGNSPKALMMLEVYKNWKFEGTDDECDAFGLAAMGLYAANPYIGPNLKADQKKTVGEWKAEYAPIFA